MEEAQTVLAAGDGRRAVVVSGEDARRQRIVRSFLKLVTHLQAKSENPAPDQKELRTRWRLDLPPAPFALFLTAGTFSKRTVVI